jgi:quercetin dioxygenase-like cupin family protein
VSRIDELLASPVLGSQDGATLDWGRFGVRFMLTEEQTGGGFSLVEHPLAPRGLASPMHTHSREDEYSYVLEGRVGFQLGDRVVYGEKGDLVAKPRGVPHSFWNAGDEPARLLELISPAGFEHYFEDLDPAFRNDGPPDVDLMQQVWAKYGLEMDMASVPELCERHGVWINPADRPKPY